jgi:ubiquitin
MTSIVKRLERNRNEYRRIDDGEVSLFGEGEEACGGGGGDGES